MIDGVIDDILNTIIEGLPIPVTVVSFETGEIKFANQTAVDVLGIKRTEITATHLREIAEIVDMNGRLVSYDELATTRARKTGQPTSSILGLRYPDGRTRWYSSSANPLRVGEVWVIITAFTDITEIMQAKDREDELRRLRHDIVTNFLHELRTPITIIMGNLELALNCIFGEPDGETKELMAAAYRGSKRLHIIIRRAAAILQDYQPYVFNLSDVVSEVIGGDEIWLVARKNKATAGLKFLFHAPRPTVVKADENKIKVLVFELISNAVKFTADGGQVSIDIKKVDGGVILSVCDTGIGISPAYHERIFERLFQVDSASNRRFEGSGMGLSVVKEIAEIHGGWVKVESELGSGATFHVYLPTTND